MSASTELEITPKQMLYGAKAIADFLGIKHRSALHLLSEGHIPHFKLGKMPCQTRGKLGEWLKSQEERAASAAA